MTETTGHRTGRWRDAWATRPARSRQERKVAGVAAALARRYAVDPILVRVAFVAAALYGPGIPLYLIGCVLLPDGNRSARGKRTASVLVAVLLTGAAVSTALVLFGPDGGWVAPLLVCAGLLAALHVTRGNLPGAGAPPPDDAADPQAVARTGPAAVANSSTIGSPEPVPPGTPPAWDPLGAAPFAWDLPDPKPDPEAEPEPPASRLTPITLSLALLAGAGVAVVALVAPGSVDPAEVPAAALAVVGAGLVVGAFRHAGRWLLPFAVVLGVVTWLATAVGLTDLDGGIGSIAEAPRTVAAVAPEYARGVGDVTLDLSGLDLRSPPGAPVPTVRTTARVGVGSVVVVVPLDADVVVRGSSGVGDVTVGGQTRDGTSPSLTVSDLGADGPGGGRIELDASAGVGSVVVSRG